MLHLLSQKNHHHSLQYIFVSFIVIFRMDIFKKIHTFTFFGTHIPVDHHLIFWKYALNDYFHRAFTVYLRKELHNSYFLKISKNIAPIIKKNDNSYRESWFYL